MIVLPVIGGGWLRTSQYRVPLWTSEIADPRGVRGRRVYPCYFREYPRLLDGVRRNKDTEPFLCMAIFT
jgi:hypothetical protein